MAKVTGYLLDEEKMTYVTHGGRVLITGDAELETVLEESSAFTFEDVPAGSYLVSIVDVAGYRPTNKFMDVGEGDSIIDLGWFGAKALPKNIWGNHGDFEKDEEFIKGEK